MSTPRPAEVRDRAEIVARWGFRPDRFQLDAFDAVDAGRHVVVAAPTGSGKTIVAEYAIERAFERGRRAFYTAPIKALSNQKFRDLGEIHGADAVGLLTGDNAINGDAPLVVMTTEVLRNMIYGRPRSLDELGTVVLDEVHFLQDTYRGPVWEEVIVHLPDHVRLVCLSATVSNARELSEWITTVRGPTDTVVETARPVPLEHLYVADDLTDDRLHVLPLLVDGAPNAAAARLDASAVRRRGGPTGRGRRRSGDQGRRRLATPSRIDVVEVLHERELLPAIHFIFSRAQCDEAAAACVAAGIRLTTEHERARIRELAADGLGSLGPDDLEVLGFAAFLERLEAGIAAHHAGMVPPFKEIVERCFAEGLLKVVFATETLAVGINMPARTVVIEKLTKFTGDHHEQLTPGEFTQLTGRAGRRGIDEIGHAVVAWTPWTRFDDVVALAASTTFPLRSVFRPTYNMVANLVRTYPRAEARRMLSLSFAQFQADRDVVRIEARLERSRLRLERLRDEAASPFGDIDDYRARSAEARAHRGGRDDAMELALRGLRPGTVIHADAGKYRGPVAVVASAQRKAGTRLSVVTPSGDLLHLSADDFGLAPTEMGSVELPTPYAPNRKDFRRLVGRRVREAPLGPRPPRDRGRGRTRGDAPAPDAPSIHPVEHDPDLRQRLRAAAQAERMEHEIASLRDRVERKHQSLATEFDAVLEVLGGYGYVDLAAWRLTGYGETLARTFHECDLLIVRCLELGLLDGLAPAELAGLTSCFVYEHRRPEDPPAPWFPSSEVRARWRSIEAVSEELAADERRWGLGVHRAPDPTFLAIAHGWVAGEGFAEVLREEDLSGGDFVRTTKQLVDLLEQIAAVATIDDTRRAARRAADAAFRGVIADAAATAAGGAR